MLSDEEQRAVYDEQGLVDEESDALSQDRCWEDYWRVLFPKVLQPSGGGVSLIDMTQQRVTHIPYVMTPGASHSYSRNFMLRDID